MLYKLRFICAKCLNLLLGFNRTVAKLKIGPTILGAIPGLLIGAVLIAADSPPRYFSTPGSYPHGLASDGENLWHTDYSAREVYCLDEKGRVLKSFPFPYGNPRGVAYSDGEIFVATANDVQRLNAETGHRISVMPIPVSGGVNLQGLTVEGGVLWVASRYAENSRIFAVDLSTGDLVRDFAAPGPNPRGLTFTDGALWNVESTNRKLYRLSPVNGTVQESHPIPLRWPRGLTFHDGRFWQVGLAAHMGIEFMPETSFSNVCIATQRYYFQSTQGDYWLPYVSSHKLHEHNSSIRRILVIQHGINDGAHDYFSSAYLAARMAEVERETLIIAPQLIGGDKLDDTPPEDMIYWPTRNPRFWGALSAPSTAVYPRPVRFSSFALLDTILDELVGNSEVYPNLEEIVISGHSGGGQFVNRYAASSAFQDGLHSEGRQVSVCYIVMNPSSYVYFDEKRYDPENSNLELGIVEFVIPENPAEDYDRFGSGLHNLYSYHGSSTPDDIREKYSNRKVVYLIGENDTGSANLDTTERAMLQGMNRYERSLIYYQHLIDHFGEAPLRRHRHAIVPGVDHNSLEMLTSEDGLRYHFQGRLRVTNFSISDSSLSLSWEGGDGLADIDYSFDLEEWTQFQQRKESPHLIEVPKSDRKFFRLREAVGP